MKLLHLLFLFVAAAEIGVPAFVGLPMVTTELDRGIALATVAASAESVFYAEAEELYLRVRTVLPNIGGLTESDQAALEDKVTDLRMALELVPGAMDYQRGGSSARGRFT